MSMLFPAGQQFGDSNFDPVGAGKLYVYDNGTTNTVSLYSDPDLSTGALSNPVVLDSSGRLTTNVYLDGTSLYTVKLSTSADAELWSRDDVSGWGGTMYYAGNPSVVPESTGAAVHAEGTGVSAILRVYNGDGDQGYIRKRGDNANLELVNADHGGNVLIRAENDSGALTTLATGDPDNLTWEVAGPLTLASYTVATVPTGAAGQMIFVTDETGGATPAFHDGTNWRRTADRAIVS